TISSPSVAASSAANLGATFNHLDPDLRIQLFEVADRLAVESSDASNRRAPDTQASASLATRWTAAQSAMPLR
ncbi:MAG: hypothetical protein ACR2RV_13725, partial [Verrucomicrobiales bacterium]